MNLQGIDVCLQQATVGGAKPAHFGPRTLPGSGWAPRHPLFWTLLIDSHSGAAENTLCAGDKQPSCPSRCLTESQGPSPHRQNHRCQLRFLLALKAGPEPRTPGMMYQNRAMLVQSLQLFQRLCNVFIRTQTGKSYGVLVPSV